MTIVGIVSESSVVCGAGFHSQFLSEFRQPTKHTSLLQVRNEDGIKVAHLIPLGKLFPSCMRLF